MKEAHDVICTLFEGDYHYGVAALVNSLSAKGYKGKVLAGYKGAPPPWFQSDREARIGELNTVYTTQGDFELHFVKLDTDYHLTNYKPDFMLMVARSIPDWNTIFYFDPDIVIVRKWQYFRDWALAGVCLCEDVNSPVYEHNPKRSGWRSYFSKYGIELKFKSPVYVNGGCVGITKENINFLEEWIEIQLAMSDAIGGLSVSDLGLPKSTAPRLAYDVTQIFKLTDQDALNATLEYTRSTCSILGPEGMSFKHGSNWMTHAVGGKKPWRKNFLLDMFKAKPPTRADKSFWSSLSVGIQPTSHSRLVLKKVTVALAAFVGRFYRRG
ncbi:hypothetical protein DDZ13_06685 [Coraliomargarita sinensis]|uniref:DUF5672 domain-containing protein n=1 Tax=Coraliomargarita sinensis TaxID=2174842 RepID=A0A317ZLH1_9BACT|nr:hypothetical protein [Coraliomargarita sinensis]PXA04221.1 hypothetical protein DDZ13_06685 [Coraliomargarita sinensis]